MSARGTVGDRVAMRAGVFEVVEVADEIDGRPGPYAKLRHLDGSVRPDFWVPWAEIKRDGPKTPAATIDASTATTVDAPESDDAPPVSVEDQRAVPQPFSSVTASASPSQLNRFFTKKERP